MSQGCAVPQLAGSDLVLWGEVSIVENCQVLPEPSLGVSRSQRFLLVCTPRMGELGMLISPSLATQPSLLSALCPAQRLTSVVYINRLLICGSVNGGP